MSSVGIVRKLEVTEVATWFDAEKDKENLMRKWMEARRATNRCSNQQIAQSEWMELCEMLHELHSNLEFVCDNLDAHIKSMKNVGQHNVENGGGIFKCPELF